MNAERLIKCLPAFMLFLHLAAPGSFAFGDVALSSDTRLSVAVLPLEIHGRYAAKRRWVYDAFLGAVVETKRFRLVDRAKIDRVLAELSLGASDLTDPAQASRIGRIVAADLIVAASLYEAAGSSKMTARIIDTETSEVIAATEAAGPGAGPIPLKNRVNELSGRIAGSFPRAKGIVIESGKDHLLIDLGSEQGMKKQMRLLLITGGGEAYGEVKITEPREAFSKVTIVRANRKPEKGDVVETR